MLRALTFRVRRKSLRARYAHAYERALMFSDMLSLVTSEVPNIVLTIKIKKKL